MKRKPAPLLIASAFALIAAAILAPRSSYEPGALMRAHAQLTGDCAACHQAWRGPQNQRCIACHGGISEDNPHSGVDIADEDVGLMPGRKLARTESDNLACLSCHGEHRGAIVDVDAAAAFACAWCHKHPAIGKVPEHVAPAMARNFSVRHLFERPFSHFQHKLLIESHFPPISGGFACASCHLVPPVEPGGAEGMSLKWSGCAGIGCHVSPQDSFMRMPASIGPAPPVIAYSGAVPVRHINAVFAHSAGHLRAACADCHFKMAASRNPSDADSLAIRQCFTCHAHQAGGPLKSAAADAPIVMHAAYAAEASGAADRRVVACGQCHLFHNFGVIPSRDFPTPAPEFPPGRKRRLLMTLYVPHLEHRVGGNAGGIGFAPVTIAPWWLGLAAIGLIALSLTGYVRIAPRKAAAQEAVAGVAPQRATEVPAIDDAYQTNVRHLYIIGEAAGTASINLAMRSGRQVIEAIAAELKRMPPATDPNLYDVLIVGCGPAGLGATAAAATMGLNYVTLERMTPASTLRAYPRAKFVQATPIDIAEYGSFFLEGDNSRERLIQEWERIIGKLGLRIEDREEVVDITGGEPLFVRTERGNVYRTRTVVLAIGVRGNPRHLNLPGEEPGRVFYSLIEPSEFTGRKILVVGGGNAGSEVAQALAAPHLYNTVSYSFRAPALTNVSPENAEKISAMRSAKLLTVYPASALKEIRPASVVLEPVKIRGAAAARNGGPMGPVEIANEVVFAMIGAELPTAFLKSIGVKMVRKGRWQA